MLTLSDIFLISKISTQCSQKSSWHLTESNVTPSLHPRPPKNVLANQPRSASDFSQHATSAAQLWHLKVSEEKADLRAPEAIYLSSHISESPKEGLRGAPKPDLTHHLIVSRFNLTARRCSAASPLQVRQEWRVLWPRSWISSVLWPKELSGSASATLVTTHRASRC